MSEETVTARPPQRLELVERAKLAADALVSVTPPETMAEKLGRKCPPGGEGTPESTTQRRAAEFSNGVHAYINDYIRMADQNAAFLFAAVGATLAFLNSRGMTKLWIKDPFTWSPTEGLAFLAVLGLLASAAASAIVLVPRKKGSRTGLVSWGAIAKCRSAGEYVRLVRATDPAELTDAKLEHCFELSRVCAKKYNALAWGLWSGGIGFVATLVYLAVT
jgi:hypothetical protein